MGAHTANNIFLCIFVTNNSSALQSAAFYEQKTYYPWTEFWGVLFASAIFIIILKIIFKWNNFSRLWGRVNRSEGSIQPV
jgi:hypothetical protein